ncbi:MAG TPA: cupin domain-containing protein [Bryobacteraceae bacterium]|nr:cupin domain-containing protein [Bryobacteraceae bacterium]
MNAKFLFARDIALEPADWGGMGWISRPLDTQSKHITQILVLLEPGCSHNFHLHPRQDEVIYVLEGEIEQWLETEKRTLKQGDAVFIGMGTVHGSFNTSAESARLLVVLSPSVTEGGYEVVDLSGEAPWNALRK